LKSLFLFKLLSFILPVLIEDHWSVISSSGLRTLSLVER
jgi:hypothetical protein